MCTYLSDPIVNISSHSLLLHSCSDLSAGLGLWIVHDSVCGRLWLNWKYCSLLFCNFPHNHVPRHYAQQPRSVWPWRELPAQEKVALCQFRYCDVCKVFIPTRVFHCKTCNVCIEEYDHHCPWLSKCVGRKNLTLFNIFIISIPCTFVYFCYLIYLLMSQQGHHNQKTWLFIPL